MAPRRLIRWKSVWLGILVLGFLLRAWLESSFESSGIQRGDSKEPIGVSSSSGYLEFYRFMGMPADAGWQITGSRYASPSNARLLWPSPLRIRIKEEVFIGDHSAREASIAYWLIVLLFLIPWASFLAWRWQRQRKLTKVHDAAPAP